MAILTVVACSCTTNIDNTYNSNNNNNYFFRTMMVAPVAVKTSAFALRTQASNYWNWRKNFKTTATCQDYVAFKSPPCWTWRKNKLKFGSKIVASNGRKTRRLGSTQATLPLVHLAHHCYTKHEKWSIKWSNLLHLGRFASK